MRRCGGWGTLSRWSLACVIVQCLVATLWAEAMTLRREVGMVAGLLVSLGQSGLSSVCACPLQVEHLQQEAATLKKQTQKVKEQFLQQKVKTRCWFSLCTANV